MNHNWVIDKDSLGVVDTRKCSICQTEEERLSDLMGGWSNWYAKGNWGKPAPDCKDTEKVNQIAMKTLNKVFKFR